MHMYNRQRADRPPAPTQQPKTGKQENKTHAYEQPPEGTPVPHNDPTTAKGPVGPSPQPNRPRPRGAQQPTKHKHMYNGQGARRPPAPTQQTENRQPGKQNACICTTARGQTGPPHQPNNRQRARRPPATSKQTTNRQNKTQTKHTHKNKTARGSAAPPHQSIYTEHTHKTMAKTLQTAPLRDGTGHTKCPINPGGSRSPAAHPWRGVG